MIGLARKTSLVDRLNFYERFDDSGLGQGAPISFKLPTATKTQAESANVRVRTSAASFTDDYRDRERSRFLGRMVVRLDEKILLVQLREVLWIQSKGNLLCLHLQNTDYDCRMTMKDLSRMLDPSYFLRVHRNAIVNLEYVTEFDLPRCGNASVRLHNGKALPISRAGRAALSRNLWSRSYVGGNGEQDSENRV